MASTWLKRQYNDVKGNLKWWLLGPAWTAGSWAIARLLKMFTSIPTWLVYCIILLISGCVFAWLFATVQRAQQKGASPQTDLQLVAAGNIEQNVSALSDFYGKNRGSFLDELEAHFQRLAAHHEDTAERERFLVRALAVGGLSYLHDMTYSSVFRSQLDVLEMLNTRGATTIDALKPYYDAAAAANHEVYAKHSFEAWLAYMKGQALIRQDGNVVQITVRGKDFLRYLVQEGKSANDRHF